MADHWMDTVTIDEQVKNLALSRAENRRPLATRIFHSATEMGVFPASIAHVYSALKKNQIQPMTIPAINLRGMTYDLARSIWQVILDKNAGAVIFELAPSEMTASDQTPEEYAAIILAAACREGYQGPVFLQGDHFHIDSPESIPDIQKLCLKAISAGFYQIDLDAAALTNQHAITSKEVQLPNAKVTATLTNFIRSNQFSGAHITLGGEVGEIGGQNTTIEDLNGFMASFLAELQPGIKGLDKISVQTGTRHGGIVLKDGRLATMPLDLNMAQKLSKTAREDYDIAGLVQHGASTLSMEQLAQLPEAGIIEVHLATQIQNIVFDHPDFPTGLLNQMRTTLMPASHGAEGEKIKSEDNLSDAQRFYHARWSAWGAFKRELWELPDHQKKSIQSSLQEWVIQLFAALRIEGKLPEILTLYNT